ncbi:hypothetical protein PENPOL_c009G06448 [Penicillium polonicum]|uniref:Uncharacterized protein n=1 Tax=Penicillium polonicum TaxID=60169 RepID=A0A1V6NFH6_PENPO|nr:hypothetical protein PENPOL_c009G06448 [Penicillium polonicum]
MTENGPSKRHDISCWELERAKGCLSWSSSLTKTRNERLCNPFSVQNLREAYVLFRRAYLLNHHILSQIQVEVINGDHFYVPTLFPIHSTAELAIAFHHLKDDIVRLLEETLRTKWQPAPQPIR